MTFALHWRDELLRLAPPDLEFLRREALRLATRREVAQDQGSRQDQSIDGRGALGGVPPISEER